MVSFLSKIRLRFPIVRDIIDMTVLILYYEDVLNTSLRNKLVCKNKQLIKKTHPDLYSPDMP